MQFPISASRKWSHQPERRGAEWNAWAEHEGSDTLTVVEEAILWFDSASFIILRGC